MKMEVEGEQQGEKQVKVLTGHTIGNSIQLINQPLIGKLCAERCE